MVSSFRDYNTPSDPRPVSLLNWLTSCKYASKVTAVRDEGNKDLRDQLKATLPAITPSGQFSYRSEKHLISHSGFIQFDVDFKENAHITNYQELKSEISKIINVAYCGLSVSGTGYWGLIPIAYTEKHSQHFDFIQNAFKEMGINIDRKPRNLAALRGYSFDPEGYFSHSAKKLELYHQSSQRPRKSFPYTYSNLSTRRQIEALINELSMNGIDITSTYDDWLNVGFAIANEFGESGRQYFHDLSSNYLGYDLGQTDDQYDRCLRAGPTSNPITIKTFFAKCRDAGILLPNQEGKSEQRVTRFTKNFPKPLINQVFSKDIISVLPLTRTGKDFNQLIMAGLQTSDGKVYDILYTSEERLLEPRSQTEWVQQLEAFFEKKFEPMCFDGNPCLGHLYP